MDAVIEKYDSEQLKMEIPEFAVGDTIRVSTKIVEGEKERIQVLQGTVIARKGSGLSETFSIHRISYGEGMERVFYLHSPRIVGIEVIKKGDVRQAKLYYLRGKRGKAAKVKEKIGVKKKKTPKEPTETPVIEPIQTETATDVTASATEVQTPIEKTAPVTEAAPSEE
ncbi:MAG: 50S ribosomal protein L19 [Chlamydiae bacterium]|nr:50S ribosomal protein L19 [Chlamydiota bacterium]